jgi:hypothetical protein
VSVATNLLPANTSGIETSTAGWTAGPTTTLAQSNRFYAGAHSLRMTPTGTSTVSATTATRVAVTAGDPLTAYAYFANETTAVAGRTATVSVSFYAGVSGGTALSTVTSSGVTLPNSTSWATPPPILITTVPAGATYAAMTVTVAGSLSSQPVVMDEAALGPPAALSGNLLNYGTQSVEVDTSGWSTLWQATIGRDSSASFEGWWSLTLTTTGTGSCRIGTVSTVPVTAGTEYQAYAWVYAPGAATYHATLRWYDSGGTLLSTSAQTWTLAASTWTRCGVIATAPAGAVSARIVVEPVATAPGEVWRLDQMAVRPTPLLPGNLLGYNAQSVESDATAWSAVSGCAVARSLSQVWEGLASLAVTAAGGDATVQLVVPVPVTPRQAYRVVPYIYTPGPSSSTVDLLYTWLNSSGATLTSFVSRWTLSAGGWSAPIGSAVAPDGATALVVGVRILSAPTGAVYYLDNVLVAPGGLGVVADPIPGTYGARVSLQGLTTGGHTQWGLWRMDASGSTTPVRGHAGDLVQQPVVGDVALAEDYEAPLGVDTTYLVTVSGGPVGYLSSTSAAVVLPEPPDTQVVINSGGCWTPATPCFSSGPRPGTSLTSTSRSATPARRTRRPWPRTRTASGRLR